MSLPPDNVRAQRPVFAIEFEDAYDDRTVHENDDTSKWSSTGDRTVTFSLDSDSRVKAAIPTGSFQDDVKMTLTLPARKRDWSDGKRYVKLNITDASKFDYLGDRLYSMESAGDWGPLGQTQNEGVCTSIYTEGSGSCWFDKLGTADTLCGIYNNNESLDLSGVKYLAYDFYVDNSTMLSILDNSGISIWQDNSETNGQSYVFDASSLQVGWNCVVIDLENPTSTTGSGITDWTDIKRIVFRTRTKNAGDAFGGSNDFLRVDNVRVLDDYQLEVWAECKAGITKKYRFTVTTGINRLYLEDKYLIGTSGSGAFDWAAIYKIHIRGKTLCADGTTLTFYPFLSRRKKTYTTGNIFEGAQLISTGADFESSGGSTSGTGASGKVASGWELKATDEAWTVQYEGNVEPQDDGWTLWGDDLGSCSDGILTTTTSNTNGCKYRKSSAKTYETIHLRARVKAQDQKTKAPFGYIELASNYKFVSVLFSGSVLWVTSESTKHQVDLNSEYSILDVYLDTIKNKYHLLVNGELILEGTPSDDPTEETFIEFGIATGDEAGVKIYWDYVYYKISREQLVYATRETDELYGGSIQTIKLIETGDTSYDITLQTSSDNYFVNSYKYEGDQYKVLLRAKTTKTTTIYFKLYSVALSAYIGTGNITIQSTSGFREYSVPLSVTGGGDYYNCILIMELGNQADEPITLYLSSVRLQREYPSPTWTKPLLFDLQGGGQSTREESGITTIPAVSFKLLEPTGETEVLRLQTDWEIRGRQVTLKRGYEGYALGELVTANIFRVDRISYSRTGAYSFSCPVDLERLKAPAMTDATESNKITIGSGDGTSLTNAIDIFMRLATSTGDGTNGDWDNLSAAQGAGIDIARFDVDKIKDTRDDHLAAWTMKFTFKDKIKDLKAWAEQEIFKPTGAYLYITDAGLIAIGARSTPLFADAVDTITEADIRDTAPRWQYQVGGHTGGIINRVTFYYDYDVNSGEFGARATFNDDRVVKIVDGEDKTSQDLYGVRELVIKCKGIQSSVSTSMLETRAKIIFKRNATGAPRVQIELDQLRDWVRIGEIYKFSDDHLPDVEAGVYGYTEALMEVQSAQLRFKEGTWQITLIDSGFRLGRTGRISNLSVDYDSATSEQQDRYVWIADENNKLGADDDDAYIIALG